MYELIKELDYFGYTPQFLISGENKFKTKLCIHHLNGYFKY